MSQQLNDRAVVERAGKRTATTDRLLRENSIDGWRPSKRYAATLRKIAGRKRRGG